MSGITYGLGDHNDPDNTTFRPFYPPLSTGTTNQTTPQPYNHTEMQYIFGVNPTPPLINGDASQNLQYFPANYLNYPLVHPNPFLLNNLLYSNRVSPHCFQTQNGTFNYGQTQPIINENSNNNITQGLYKQIQPHLKTTHSELSSGFENGEVKSPPVETVEQSLSQMNIGEKVDDDKGLDDDAVTSNLSSASDNTGLNETAKPDNIKSKKGQPAKLPSPKKTNKKPHVARDKQVSVRQNGSTNSQQNSIVQSQYNSNNVVPNDSDLINGIKDNSPLLKELMDEFNFNPQDFDINTKNAKFFVIKSYSEDDVFRSIKHSIWTSTEHGNNKLNEAFSSQESNGIMAPIYLFFSVTKSGHFCGVAEMKSNVEFDAETGIFEQAKWKGRFDVRWIYVKDVPNKTFKHILVESNENKPVFFSRDTQEIPENEGIEVLKIIHNYKAKTSLLDDFSHYENREANQRERRK